jgi:hypothetical protein
LVNIIYFSRERESTWVLTWAAAAEVPGQPPGVAVGPWSSGTMYRLNQGKKGRKRTFPVVHCHVTCFRPFSEYFRREPTYNVLRSYAYRLCTVDKLRLKNDLYFDVKTS